MPYVQRIVEPKFVSRKSLFDETGKSVVNDYELEAVANNTLSNVLRQLASVVLVANDIFEELARQLQEVHERSSRLRTSISLVEAKLALSDPKMVTVPEGDMCTFSQRTAHYKTNRPITTGLFSSASRPGVLQRAYDLAGPTPILTIRQLDKFRRDGTRSSKFFVCTPVLGGARRRRLRKVDLEIETRKPVVVEDLRRWTSAEALGDITVMPDNTSKMITNDTEAADHLLPSPEEQMIAVALRFPPSIVAVDVSGKPFDRMSGLRRSLIADEVASDAAGPRRRARGRKHREKRRNTIAGTSHKEIEQAMAGETGTETEGFDFEPLSPLRSKSNDPFQNFKTTSPTDNIKNHLNSLKNWSKTKLRMIGRSNHSTNDSCRPSFQGSDVVDDVNIYEVVSAPRRRRAGDRERERLKERKNSTSSSAASIPINAASIATTLAVKLRENSLQRRHRRNGKLKDEPVHSSSGNWSASSESGRASIVSETTAPPKSSTTTSSNSLNQHHVPPVGSAQSRRRFVNVSTSSSVSEGTLTPDINDVQLHDLDGETSSVYSCDTEGYYTSFHLDSGLKTLKEEDIALSLSMLQLQMSGPTAVAGHTENSSSTTTTFNSSAGSGTRPQMTAENEYELFGKGSTSTTTSSAGTVCTTLLAPNGYGSNRSLSQFAPAVPERKSSLDRKTEKKAKMLDLITNGVETATCVALIHDSPSPDSGHNTSSSPAGSTHNSHSPNEQLDFSESDLEGCDRIERIRSKTAMTSCRIPSLCVITPPQSDDDTSLRNYHQGHHRPLHITIPAVPCALQRQKITDIYALPDKTKKKTNNIKTISTNGVLETNLDAVLDDTRKPLHITVSRESGYATIQSEVRRAPSPSGGTVTIKKIEKEVSPKSKLQPVFKSSLLPSSILDKFKGVVSNKKRLEAKEKLNNDGEYVMIVDKKTTSPVVQRQKEEYVSLNDIQTPKEGENSLERKKRQGARVTLDSEGKVLYSTDSLKRKKQHTTFVPGKYVRESPTPSPLPDHRTPKAIRPVNCSGLIKTNSDERASQAGKIIIKAGVRNTDSPTKDFVRTPTRVVSPMSTPRHVDKGVRVVLENGRSNILSRSVSPTSSDYSSLERTKRCISPSSSSSSSNETKKDIDSLNPDEGPNKPRWVSQHPAVTSRPSELVSPSGFPRSHPMYWTLPSRPPQLQHNTRQFPSSRKDIGAMQGPAALPSTQLVRRAQEFSSSTPTKERPNNMELTFSPISKETFLSPKTTMTSEQIFAAVHKSKKKLNLKEGESRSDSPSLSPGSSEGSLQSDRSRERTSWSPSSDSPEPRLNEPRGRRSWAGAGTSINAFKKLLLQHGAKRSPAKDSRLSAVEQLKLSKPDANSTPTVKTDSHVRPRPNVSSRGKAQWKFYSPRTDILSSTIPEDCSEVEMPEDAVKYRKAFEASSPLAFRHRDVDKSHLYSPKTNNPIANPNSATRLAQTPENSIIHTKKLLEQARREFFLSGEQNHSSSVVPATVTSAFISDPGDLRRPPVFLSTNLHLNHNDNRSKILNVSLETAL